MTARYIVGDTRAVLATLEPGSVDLVLTSPPFLALRSYLPADHPDKAHEIGSEATPGAYIDTLLDVVEACSRVLAPHGTMMFELGDTYAGSGGAGGDYAEGGFRDGQPLFRQKDGDKSRGRNPKATHAFTVPMNGGAGWPLDRSLCLIPELFRISLVYGFNPLTGRQTPRWRARNVVRWVRPNPPVGCVDDQTEALTPDGWQRHDQLSDGDLIAAYDPQADSCRFLPAKFVRWEREGEQMVTVEKRSSSQWLTEDHRTWVRTRKLAPHVRLAADLTNESQTLLCAPFDDVAGPSPVTVERAALLGWFIAEGTAHHRQARVVQSQTANPHKVGEIRRLLDADGADYRETSHTASYNGSTIVAFTIKGELAEWLNLHQKRLPMAYVTTWPQAQAQALFDALVDGDGHRRAHRGVLFHQQDEAVADAVQILAIRLGYRASKSWQPSLRLWQITMSASPVQDRRWTKIRKWDGEGIVRQSYTGTVWCPQVETTFWLARRKGKTFVTGNSLGDKFRPATSELVVLCRNRRYFDLDAVRTEPTSGAAGAFVKNRSSGSAFRGITDGSNRREETVSDPAGAPPLDWWKIPTQPYEGAHYATWPEQLCVIPVKAMCPARVCRTCGKPSQRITETINAVGVAMGRRSWRADPENIGNGHSGAITGKISSAPTADVRTLGWSDCGHNQWRPGMVLDPFGGSGTTGAVATGHGRDAILIDLDERNAELAVARIGPLICEVVYHESPGGVRSDA